MKAADLENLPPDRRDLVRAWARCEGLTYAATIEVLDEHTVIASFLSGWDPDTDERTYSHSEHRVTVPAPWSFW